MVDTILTVDKIWKFCNCLLMKCHSDGSAQIIRSHGAT